jgi:hypothetical protein
MVDMDDIHFHPTPDGNKKHNVSNNKTLKRKATNQGMQKLVALICHDDICE